MRLTTTGRGYLAAFASARANFEKGGESCHISVLAEEVDSPDGLPAGARWAATDRWIVKTIRTKWLALRNCSQSESFFCPPPAPSDVAANGDLVLLIANRQCSGELKSASEVSKFIGFLVCNGKLPACGLTIIWVAQDPITPCALAVWR